jgi:hypothetical protein
MLVPIRLREGHSSTHQGHRPVTQLLIEPLGLMPLMAVSHNGFHLQILDEIMPAMLLVSKRAPDE